MPGDLVMLARFGSPAEARIALALLQEAGIQATLEGEAAGNNLNYLGTALGGVKLLVREEDADRAAEVLSDGDEEPHPPGENPWKCPACGAQVSDDADVCWSCGTARQDAEATERGICCAGCGTHNRESALTCAVCGADLSAPNRREKEPDDLEPNEAAIALRRAWRASIVGLVLCPPLLHIYSITQLLEYKRLKAGDGSDDDRRAPWILLFDVAMVVGAIAFYKYGI